MALNDPLGFVIWLVVAVLLVWVLLRKQKYVVLKLFASVWIMPGTIVCGAAGLAPWIMTTTWVFNDSGCANILSLSITLVFNLAIVFGVSKFYGFFKQRKRHA